MVAKLGALLSRWSVRAVPDPFVLALLLTMVVVTGALFVVSPTEVLTGWVDGFASKPLLAFALQMCLVLVTGHALATSPPVQRLVQRLARLDLDSGSAAMLVAFVACVAAVVHWGLGAIMGAFLAREIGRHAAERGTKLHYPLLGGAAYAGLAVWHGGLSGSAPLKVAEEGHFAAELVGTLPVETTLFSPLNLVVTGSLCVIIPLAFRWMTPAEQDRIAPDPERLPPTPQRKHKPVDGVPAWLAETAGVGRLIGMLGFSIVVAAWLSGTLRLDLNLVNLLFLFAGIGLQGGIRHYVGAIADGARGAGAIILQFPFYFGILGVMKAAGMIEAISRTMVNVANADTFPALAFLSAGVVNLFVPSGGGQWAVQGEIVLRAATELGVEPSTAVMAFSYGDAWTNMLQPFWALPLLGIMGLEAKDIIGYTGVVCLIIAVWVPAMLMLVG